jgi:hypothetical protein
MGQLLFDHALIVSADLIQVVQPNQFMTITVNDRNALLWQADWEGFNWQYLLIELAALSLKAQLSKGIF